MSLLVAAINTSQSLKAQTICEGIDHKPGLGFWWGGEGGGESCRAAPLFDEEPHGGDDEREVGSSNWDSGHNVLAAAALKGTAAIYKRGEKI